MAVARFGWHKERVLRLAGELCGSRFGWSVVVPRGVVPGEVSRPPRPGRASGTTDDARRARPYGAYTALPLTPATSQDGDAMARLDVRVTDRADRGAPACHSSPPSG